MWRNRLCVKWWQFLSYNSSNIRYLHNSKYSIFQEKLKLCDAGWKPKWICTHVLFGKGSMHASTFLQQNDFWQIWTMIFSTSLCKTFCNMVVFQAEIGYKNSFYHLFRELENISLLTFNIKYKDFYSNSISALLICCCKQTKMKMARCHKRNDENAYSNCHCCIPNDPIYQFWHFSVRRQKIR